MKKIAWNKILCLLIIFAFAIITAPVFATPSCISCHSAPTHDRNMVTRDTLAGSPHQDLSCLDCHTGMPDQAVMHPVPSPKVNCLTCHGPQPRMGAKTADPVQHGRAGVSVELLPGCVTCHGSHAVRTADVPASSVSRQNIVRTCGTCHGPGGAAAEKLGDRFVVDYRNSVHGQADPARPGLYAAVCTDCHGEHSILPSDHPESLVAKANVSQTCGQCHQTAFKDYIESSHGKALARGNLDAPSCADCHGEHGIVRTQDPDSPVGILAVAENCAKCHADMDLVQRHGLPTGVVESYQKSYHGIVNRYGEVEVASCSSCHQAHLVLPQSDERSSIHPDNLPATCGSPGCHPGIGTNVTLGNVHLQPSRERDVQVYWVEIFFGLFTYTTMAVLALIMTLDTIQRKRAPKQAKPHPTSPVDKVRIKRFSWPQVRQHQILIISFTILVITGFPLKFPDWAVSQFIINAVGGMTPRATIHRLMGLVLLFAGTWHVMWVLTTRHGRIDFLKMLPEKEDLFRVWGLIQYYLGFKKDVPGFGRFNVFEKFDYMAVGWGSVIMGTTGLILWFPEIALRFMPKWGVDVAHVVHSDEAVLAFIVILFWHFYHVHYKPTVFPMNRAWLDGTVALEDMKHEHMQEYERLRVEYEQKLSAGELDATTREAPPHGPEPEMEPEPEREEPAEEPEGVVEEPVVEEEPVSPETEEVSEEDSVIIDDERQDESEAESTEDEAEEDQDEEDDK